VSRGSLRKLLPDIDGLCQAEVQNLGLAPGGNKDVRRLDVAMDDAFAVCRVQSVGNLNCQVQ
jgi:hypothetical protein